MRFDGKVVIVTGGGSGIGREAARLFAAGNAIVAINDIRAEAAEAAAAEIRAQGGHAFAAVGDAADPEQVRTLVRRIVADHAQVDILVNNAAMITVEPAEAVSPDVWNRTIAVNLGGPFYWAQAVATESMLPRSEGVIVNVASIAGLVAGPRMAPYTATKHGVVGLTKALAVEWGPRGIRVNALCPGLTETAMVKAVRQNDPEMFEARQNRIPLGRPATPEEQAYAILFLASREASSIQGLIMNVDGGTVAMSSGYSIERGG